MTFWGQRRNVPESERPHMGTSPEQRWWAHPPELRRRAVRDVLGLFGGMGGFQDLVLMHAQGVLRWAVGNRFSWSSQVKFVAL